MIDISRPILFCNGVTNCYNAFAGLVVVFSLLNPRKDHLAMDGEERGIDEPFSNDKQYPSGEPNCRCRVDYSF